MAGLDGSGADALPVPGDGNQGPPARATGTATGDRRSDFARLRLARRKKNGRFSAVRWWMVTAPIGPALAQRRRVLLAGCGGGYDILGAVPLAHELRQAGHEVYLASLSFSSLGRLAGARRHPSLPNLHEVTGGCATPDVYCPEAWLARWYEDHGVPTSIWAFDKTGVQPLVAAYQHLVNHLALDAIVLVDGGVDSILRGDESSLGTPEEDLTSLAAVNALAGPETLVACVGFGAELREGICHAQVLDRIAELAQKGGYLGASAMTQSSPAGKAYREALAFVFENQRTQRQSHIHGVIAAAMDGEFGPRGPDVWLSPLLPLYWYFSLRMVAGTHLFLSALVDTRDIFEVTARIEGLRKHVAIQKREKIPI
jgi:hypothetical protein